MAWQSHPGLGFTITAYPAWPGFGTEISWHRRVATSPASGPTPPRV